MATITLRKPDGSTAKVETSDILEVRPCGKYKSLTKADYVEHEFCDVHTRTGVIRVEGSATQLKRYLLKLSGRPL